MKTIFLKTPLLAILIYTLTLSISHETSTALTSAHNITFKTTHITDSEKKILHKKYNEILNEEKSKRTWGESLVNIEVTPIDAFLEEDWVSLDLFRIRVIEAIEADFIKEDTNTRAASASHTNTVVYGQKKISLTISANFNTTYDSVNKRQIFTSYTKLKVSPNTTSATWSKTGYDNVIMEGGRTYNFNLTGKLAYNGTSKTYTLVEYFSCNAQGGVS